MRLENFNWGPGIFIITYHLMLIAGLPIYLYYTTPQAGLIIASVVLLFLSGISISAGYHRFYAHKAYNSSKIFESMLLFFSTMALQGSALYWSYEHRNHHRYTDKDEDPHSIKKGFMYAHMLWLFKKPGQIDEKIVYDLTKNKLVMFQHKYYLILTTLINFAAFLLVWELTGDLAGAFVIAFLARIFLLHHFTWFINSLAHTWGARTYSGEQTAVDNYIIALVTFGEGYHNYHHVFASDYRNGIKWYHFDPSKWLVWLMNKVGLTKDLKKVNHYAIKRTIIMEDKKILLEKIKESMSAKKEALEKRVHELSEKIMLRINELSDTMHKYSQINVKEQKKTLRKQIREFKANLNNGWREWTLLSREVMSLS